ncbi:MAG: hypothetical protein K2M17_05200, partial [Bacilli bacterium]|nr:hypothetical protein [Bacilli bacterium]
VIDHLNMLDILYVAEKRSDGILAEYIISGENAGKIIVYGATCFADADKPSLDHEFGHVFTRFDDLIFGNGIYEGVRVIMNNEYAGAIHGEYPHKIYDRSYDWFERAIPFLCEVLDADTLKKFHADANPQIIVDALTAIISDEEMAYQLIVDFDFVDLYKKGLLSDDVDYEDYEIKLGEISTLLKKYYETKYQTSIFDHLDVLYYYDPTLAYQYVIAACGLDEHVADFISPTSEVTQYKTYLNSSLTGNDLILNLCTSTRIEKEYCTAADLLEGPEPYESEAAIPFEKMPDGMYEVFWYTPAEYQDFNFSAFNKVQKLVRE